MDRYGMDVEGENIISSPSLTNYNAMIEVGDFLINQDVSNIDSMESGENMPIEDKVDSPPDSSKKRSRRLLGDVIPNNKRSVKLKKTSCEMDEENKTKRRERINEKLRILQNLVPNGTKVRVANDKARNLLKGLQN
ncbi:transcription factor bHLH139-like [Nicotiana sylvestris]|uniref:transcription factor bHLH139-like n=1 Tax=Nicotiana sylvestris TaxID=4096 RepID=UPI00388C8E81